MPRARLLDVSRLVSRAGLAPTGIDRVEYAYLDGFVRDTEADLFGLSRTAFGFVLIDRSGLGALRDAVRERKFPAPDGLSRLARGLSPAARRGQSFVRRHRIGRCRPRGLTRLLARLPSEFVYFNVGHGNLSDETLQSVGSAGAAEIAVLIHDTIPLDLSHLQRPKTASRFRASLAAATRFATTLICPTRAVAADLARHAGPSVRLPRVIVAPLGVSVPVPLPACLAPGVVPERPYFVVLGTLEPRKNHAMLLDVWDELGRDAPTLMVLGRRGWRNEDVFARLDAKPANVEEHAGLSDGAVAALLDRAHGLLFPSFAEGTGLPPLEAAGLGVPVICSDLPACRETMGDWPVYVDPSDRSEWKRQVLNLAQNSRPTRRTPLPLPSWDAHLKKILGSVG